MLGENSRERLGSLFGAACSSRLDAGRHPCSLRRVGKVVFFFLAFLAYHFPPLFFHTNTEH